MKLRYYPDTDTLFIGYFNWPGAEAREVADGVIIGIDSDGNIVGIDIDRAFEKLDLKTVDSVSRPIDAARTA